MIRSMAETPKQQEPVRTIEKSESSFQAAQRVLAGGVNSPVRAFSGVGGAPIFIARAEGAVIVDVDGNEYVDYVGSWGPMILGHADKRVAAAASKALDKGWSYGAPTEIETRLAECILGDFPSMEKLRFVNSGTEATMSTIRLARGYTGRDCIVKFEGCYHGHVDALLVKAGSGLATFGTPSSAGVPEPVTASTLVAPYNDIEAIDKIFAQHGSKIAAVLVEPVAGNMGCVPPTDDFLAELRRLCTEHGALLIFDEVMTGYRVGIGGAQQLYGIAPDITCLGKIIGGGLPVGAYGASAEIMDKLSPAGPVYQAGTLSGNPLAMATGLATLQAVHEKGFYSQLELLAARLADGLEAAARHAGISVSQNRAGSMSTLFFNAGPVTDWSSAARSDTALYARFFHAMLEQGFYLAPSQFEAMFVSIAHTFEQIDATIAAAEDALRSLKA